MVLDNIFKEYDIRGVIGDQLNIEKITAIGAAFITAMKLEGKKIVIGYDMRPTSLTFSEAFAEGATLAGVKEIQTIGLTSTDGLYFASGIYDSPAVMFTASHNPAEYNGIKLCMEKALGLSRATGLEEIKTVAENYLLKGLPDNIHPFTKKFHKSVTEEYVTTLRQLAPLENAEPKHIIIDAGNGMGGHISPLIFEGTKNIPPLPHKITPMFFQLDGTFPNHPADPLNPENLKPLQNKIVEEGADIGLAFDGDADRCFIVDEKGNPVPPSTVASIIAHKLLQKHPHSTILYSQTTSRVFKETIESNSGTAHMVKVGHSTAKQEMKKTGAIFGAEHSAHYYFKDFYGADSGILAALHVLEVLNSSNLTMSELAKQFNPYHSSGELNTKVSDVEKVQNELIRNYGETFTWNTFDGVFFEKQLTKETWVWFNVRPSNTEPLLRLNVESNSVKVLNHMVQELTNLISSV